MAKRSAGAFQNVEEVASKVETLEQTGFSRRDMTVISSKENEANIRDLADVEIISVEKGQSIKDNLTLSHGLDKETIQTYDTTINQGGYVVLVEGEAEPGEGTLDTENEPISSPGGGNVPPPGFGVDPRTPPNLNSDMHGDPMNNKGDVPMDDSRNPHTGKGREESSHSSDNSGESSNLSDNDATERAEDPIPELTNDDDANTDQSNINVRPIKNTGTPHSPRAEEQSDIPNESLDSDRGSYK